MATNVQYIPFSSYSLAEYKLWGQAPGNALTAFGWSLDANTLGMVNWSTIKYTPAQDTVGLAVPGTANFRGAYSTASINYALGDVVTYDGATWVNTVAFTSSVSTPYPGTDISSGTTRWRLFAYEVWVSAVTPAMYIRFVYAGNTSTTNNPAMYITVGTSSADVLTLTSVATASGGNTVYTGTITGGGTNNFTGKTFIIAGFTTSANNGTFVCQSNTTTTLTLNNASGVAETHAATASSYSSNLGTGTNQVVSGTNNLVPGNVGASTSNLGNTFPAYFSGDSGNRFAMSLWNDQNNASSGCGVFAIERSLSNTGSYYTTPSGIGIVQSVSDTYRASGAGPITKAFPSDNTTGNTIIVLASNVGTSASGISISDTNSNTYHSLFAAANLTVNGDAQIGWYAENIASGPNTVTVSWTTGSTPAALALMEYTGLKTSGSLDQNPAANTGNSGTWSTNSATTTQNEELLIALVVSASGSTVATAPFVREATTNNPTVFGIFADERVDTTGTYSASGTNSSSQWVAQLATFEAATNSPPITPYWSMFWLGFSNTFISQAFVNTTGSTWLKTTADNLPWVLGTHATHGLIIESSTSGDSNAAYMNIPILPFFPLVGWVGNPCTAIVGLKLADIPKDGEFTVQMYGTTHTYFGIKTTSFATMGGTANNYFALRFD